MERGRQPKPLITPPFADGACHNGQHRAPRARTLIVGESLEVPRDFLSTIFKDGTIRCSKLRFLGMPRFCQSDQGLHFVGTLGTCRPAGPNRLEDQLNYLIINHSSHFRGSWDILQPALHCRTVLSLRPRSGVVTDALHINHNDCLRLRRR